MARHPKQNEYEQRSRLRRAIKGAAAFNGWVDLPVLSAFIADDGSLMVFDTHGNRYLMEASDAAPTPIGTVALPASPPASPVVSIETGKLVSAALPDGVNPAKVTDKFAASVIRQALGDSRKGNSLADARKTLAANAQAFLAATALSDRLAGPGWQEDLSELEG